MTQTPTSGASAAMHTSTMTFNVQVPLGMAVGETMLVQAPNGQHMSVCIPVGVRAGQSFPLVYSPGTPQAYPSAFPPRAPAANTQAIQTGEVQTVQTAALPIAQAHPVHTPIVATPAPAGSAGTDTQVIVVQAEAAGSASSHAANNAANSGGSTGDRGGDREVQTI
jgi:hypothetical protein